MNRCPHCGSSMTAMRGLDLCLNILCNGGQQDGTWAANQAAYGNPGASPNASGGAGLTQQNPYANSLNALAQYNPFQARQNPLQNASPGGVGWISASGIGQLTRANMLAQYRANMLAQYVAAQHEQLLAAQKPLEHAGTTFGEIVGWRIWGLSQGYLTSYSADYAWLPGHPTEGDVSDHGIAGIWAFKDAHRAFKKALQSADGTSHWTEGWVTGSVWMYGEVVEHQIGYRSQYATVRSIEAVIPNETKRQGWRQWAQKREMRQQSQAMLEELRERYIASSSAIET